MATPTGEFIPTPPLPMQSQVSPYNPIGIGETALSLGTGAIAMPLAGWYGAGTELFGGDGKAAAGRLADALTYKPTTDYGQASASAFSDFADKSGLSSLPPVVSGIPAPRLGAGATRYAGQQYGVPMLEKSLTMYEQGRLTPGMKPVSDIVPIDTAKNIKMATTLPSDEMFLNAVKNTPNAEIIDDGLKISLVRNQKPEQAGMESVRGGVFYLPKGSANVKHYSTGKMGYGGTEPISGETIVKNPLFVKGATGGKAPAAAYDSLMGKGAYEKMREDVLQTNSVRTLPSNLLSDADKAARVGETLSKYGVDPSLARYIMQNSKFGNQLPYALQELIVSEAARKAGHDSIVGFSKKKTGEPFISELFDLREETYPTKQGGFSLRDEFTVKQNPFTIEKTDASSTFGQGAQQIRYTDPNSGGFIKVVQKPDGTASVLGLEVPKEFQGTGVGKKLQAQVMADFPTMEGQVSSKAAAKNAYDLGRRPIGNPNASLKDILKMIDEDTSVNLVSPDMQKLRTLPTRKELLQQEFDKLEK
jgi:ribosomal protein S18 acetylase RimI-like enzyme